jgi:hypothetical protein
MAKKVVNQGSGSQYPNKALPETDNSSSFNLKDELVKEWPAKVWRQISTSSKKGLAPEGEIKPGQEIIFKNSIQENTLPEARQEQDNYFQEKIDFQRRINLNEASLKLKDRQETTAKINLIREEIKAIADNTTQINSQIKEIETSSQANINQPSQYQLNFLELLLEFLKDLREKVEEGNSWLAAFQKRSSKKNYFWGQVKKSGAKFLLSSDRTPATQTG